MSVSLSGNSVNLAQGCPSVTHTKITSCLSLPQHGPQAALGSSGSGMWRNWAERSALPRVEVNLVPLFCPLVWEPSSVGSCFHRQGTRRAAGD